MRAQTARLFGAKGLQLLKSHPLFGVGFGNLPDYLGHTAHNSVVVCAAELGLFGLFFWSLFLFSTVRDALAIASPAKVSEGEPIVAEEGLFPQATRKIEAVDKAEVNRLGRLLVLSLTGFLVAGWFLSRAFVMTFFLFGGMAEVVYEMALQRGMIAPRLPFARAAICCRIGDLTGIADVHHPPSYEPHALIPAINRLWSYVRNRGRTGVGRRRFRHSV